MTGIEILYSFLISIAAGLCNSALDDTRHALDEARRKKLKRLLEDDANYFQNVEKMRPLNEEIELAAINVVKIKSELAIQEHEEALFLLVEDPLFRGDLAKWILAEDPKEEETQTDILLNYFFRALDLSDLSNEDKEKIGKEFLDQTKKEIFSNQVLSNWRMEIRIRAIQTQVKSEGIETRNVLSEGFSKLSQEVGTLIPTTADDIKKLRSFSESSINAIQRYAFSTGTEKDLKIERDVVSIICDAVIDDSLLLVGEPGSGKSIALCDVALNLRLQGYEAIYLDVQKIQSESLGNLKNELGLNQGIVEVLKDCSGDEPAFFLVDALDAARSSQSAGMIRDLINGVHQLPRWKVVVTMRKFDLRYAADIKEIFAGSPPSEPYSDREFSMLRHANIPIFSVKEIREIADRSLMVKKLLQFADETLSGLLRVPFNMRLATGILNTGIELGELTPISSQLELLDKYWLTRVIQADLGGDARESVALQAAKKMVNKHSLTILRSEVGSDPSSSNALHQLLSSNVLVEWLPPGKNTVNRYTLAFSHNILFDYVVELALFRNQEDNLIALFSSNPDLVFVIRPSVVFSYQRLWSDSDNHEGFWVTVLKAIQTNKLSKVCQLVGPASLIKFAQNIDDFALLVEALKNHDAEIRDAANKALCYIARGLLANDLILTGKFAGPWIELTVKTSEALNSEIVGPISALLNRCFETESTREQKTLLNKCSQNLMNYILEDPSERVRNLQPAITGLCNTAEPDNESTANLLRTAMGPNVSDVFRNESLIAIAQNIKQLYSVNPSLASEVFENAFGNPIDSNQNTTFIEGTILSLSSNLRQDYEAMLDILGDSYKSLIELSPLYAIPILINTLNSYVRLKHLATDELYFEFRNQNILFLSDGSDVWDSSDIYQYDPPIKMLHCFEEYLGELRGLEDDDKQIELILDLIASNSPPAVLWKRLLNLGMLCPNSIGELLSSSVILTANETRFAAFEFLKKVFPLLDSSLREKIEHSILSITSLKLRMSETKSYLIRNRMLTCLDLNTVVTKEAKDLIEQINLSPPEPEEPFRFTVGRKSLEKIDRIRLEQEGMGAELTSDLRFRELLQAIQEFNQNYENSPPHNDTIFQTINNINLLKNAINSARCDNVDLKMSERAQGAIATAFLIILQNDSASKDAEILHQATEIFVNSSRSPEPKECQERNKVFEKLPSWDSGLPRVVAIKGLLYLVEISDCVSTDVQQAIDRMSRDEAHCVRFLLVNHMNVLSKISDKFMWSIAKSIVESDESYAVMESFVYSFLRPKLESDPDIVLNLINIIYDRMPYRKDYRNPRDACLRLLRDAYLRSNEMLAKSTIDKLVENSLQNLTECQTLVFSLRDFLSNRKSITDGVIRERAWKLLNNILEKAIIHWNLVLIQFENSLREDVPQEDLSRIDALVILLYSITTELYFASGAYDESKFVKGDSITIDLIKNDRVQFWKEVQASLDQLELVPIPARVVHRLLNLLISFIDIDPKKVFHRIGNLIINAKKSGYQYDSVAANQFVEIIELYLSEYAHHIRQDEKCRELMIRTLDIFVSWPQAYKLVYRLEEIYR